MDLLEHFFTAVDKAVFAANNGCEPVTEISYLAPLKSELRKAFDQLLLRPDPIKAAARSAEVRAVTDDEIFYVSWRLHGESEEVKGRAALAKRLSIKRTSVDVYLSRGKGTFTLKRHHPKTTERDQLIVTKAQALQEAEPAKFERLPTRRTITTQTRPNRIPEE